MWLWGDTATLRVYVRFSINFDICVAAGGTCVQAMCCGRHRVEYGVQQRGGVGSGGAGRRGACRGGVGCHVTDVRLLAPGDAYLPVGLCLVKSAISELHPLHREVHSENVSYADIRTNMYNL